MYEVCCTELYLKVVDAWADERSGFIIKEAVRHWVGMAPRKISLLYYI